MLLGRLSYYKFYASFSLSFDVIVMFYQFKKSRKNVFMDMCSDCKYVARFPAPWFMIMFYCGDTYIHSRDTFQILLNDVRKVFPTGIYLIG